MIKKNRIISILLVFIILISMIVSVSAAEVSIPVLDFDGLPFVELPDLSNYQSYWLVKLEDETYSLVSTNGSFRVTVDGVTYQNMIRLTSSLKKSVYTSGTEWHTWLYDGVKWVDKGTNSNNYSSLNLSGENFLIYCTVPVYDVDGNIFWPSDIVDDPSEPEDPTEEPTDPTEPPVVDDGENDSLLLDGIKDFFGNLFKPITDLIDSIVVLSEKLDSIWERFGSLEEMWEKFKGYTFDPIIEFFNSINIDSLNVIMKIWEFPIIGEFSIGKVALLVISGILILMITF